MDPTARAALAALVREEVRTELAAELRQIDELRLRLNVLEAQAGIPTGLPRGAKHRPRPSPEAPHRRGFRRSRG